jgi:hypothetical protein
MDKKINYIHLSKIRLLPVIFLLLCSCVVFAQMPTELITNPNLPPKNRETSNCYTLSKEYRKKRKRIKKRIRTTNKYYKKNR